MAQQTVVEPIYRKEYTESPTLLAARALLGMTGEPKFTEENE
jgi:hypothetical protein